MKRLWVLLIISQLIMFSGCTTSSMLVKQCIDCLNDFDQTETYYDFLFNIKYSAKRPGIPCITTNYVTLEERLGIKLNPDFERMVSIDSTKFQFDENQFSIFCVLSRDENENIILDEIKDIVIREEKRTIELINSMCNRPMVYEFLVQKVKEYCFQILKSQKEIGAGWFCGYQNYIEINCKAGYKRLIFSRDKSALDNLTQTRLFYLKENWYFYNDLPMKDKKINNVIRRKRIKFGW